MKANELRLGNWVQLENYTPYQINNHHFELNENGYNECLDISIPIPLTEEWLFKFRFEKIKYPYVDGNGLECDLFESYWGDFYKVEDYYLPLPYYFADAFGDNFKLKYVHTLQNLYFALTGEELTIKE